MFNTNVSWIKEWKILPFSAKDITTKDLVKKYVIIIFIGLDFILIIFKLI
jgi:hypothetical protein